MYINLLQHCSWNKWLSNENLWNLCMLFNSVYNLCHLSFKIFPSEALHSLLLKWYLKWKKAKCMLSSVMKLHSFYWKMLIYRTWEFGLATVLTKLLNIESLELKCSMLCPNKMCSDLSFSWMYCDLHRVSRHVEGIRYSYFRWMWSWWHVVLTRWNTSAFPHRSVGLLKLQVFRE
jgi:hypothetical protein